MEDVIAGKHFLIGTHLLSRGLQCNPRRVDLVGVQRAVSVDGESPVREEPKGRSADDVEWAVVDRPSEDLVLEVGPDALVERGGLGRHVGHREGLIGTADVPGESLAGRDVAPVVAAIDEGTVIERLTVDQVVVVEGVGASLACEWRDPFVLVDVAVAHVACVGAAFAGAERLARKPIGSPARREALWPVLHGEEACALDVIAKVLVGAKWL